MSTVDVSTEILIKRPVAVVADYSSDPANATQWYVNIKSVTCLEPSGVCKPLRIGMKVDFMAQFLGKKLQYTYEIVEFIPEKKFVMRTASGPFPMETTYTWKSISPNETQMTLRNRGTPSGFGKFFTPFMAMAMRKANRKDLERLKGILEN